MVLNVGQIYSKKGVGVGVGVCEAGGGGGGGPGVGVETWSPTFWLIDDRLYSAILRSLEQTHCARMWFYMSE